MAETNEYREQRIASMKALQDLIDEVLARDMATLDKDMMMKPDGN